jgi:hypothetical protein
VVSEVFCYVEVLYKKQRWVSHIFHACDMSHPSYP